MESWASREEDQVREFLWGLEIQIECLQIHLVPSVDDLASIDDDEGRAIQCPFLSAGGEPELVAKMRQRGFPANGDDITLGHYLLNVGVNVWECSAKNTVSFFESLGAVKDSVGTKKTVSLSLQRKHPVDGLFTLLVPDLLEPIPRELLVRLRHGAKLTPHNAAISR
jgi:hypothetical protein